MPVLRVFRTTFDGLRFSGSVRATRGHAKGGWIAALVARSAAGGPALAFEVRQRHGETVLEGMAVLGTSI